jgi:hypothetical protein
MAIMHNPSFRKILNITVWLILKLFGWTNATVITVFVVTVAATALTKLAAPFLSYSPLHLS